MTRLRGNEATACDRLRQGVVPEAQRGWLAVEIATIDSQGLPAAHLFAGRAWPSCPE
jgi:hypothetical protein